MAENKKSFLLYADLINTVDELDDSEAGILFKHILKYVNDLNPECPDKITKIAFEPIKLQLKRDLQKWEDIKIKRSKAGKASADKREHMSTHVESVEQTSTNPTVTDNVTVTVNVTDNVIKDEEAPPPIITSISIQDDRTNANHAFSDEKFHYLCHQKGLTERQKVGEIMTLFLTHRSGNGFPESNSRDFRQHFFNWIGKGGHTHLMTKISAQIQNTEHHVPKADPAAIQAKYGRRN